MLHRFLSQIVRDGLVSSTLQQELDDLSMPIVACSPERGAAQIVPRVWVRSSGQKELCQLNLSVACGFRERRIPVVVRDVYGQLRRRSRIGVQAACGYGQVAIVHSVEETLQQHVGLLFQLLHVLGLLQLCFGG